VKKACLTWTEQYRRLTGNPRCPESEEKNSVLNIKKTGVILKIKIFMFRLQTRVYIFWIGLVTLINCLGLFCLAWFTVIGMIAKSALFH
jgi:hypothetical protein